MWPIATGKDIGGVRIGAGLASASDGTVSVVDQFSLYFSDLVYGATTAWIATGSYSIGKGTNAGVAILEVGPQEPITFDLYYLDNRTAYSSAPPTVGTVSFPAGSGAVSGTITFNESVSLVPGNVLGLSTPTPADQQAKGLRLVISVSNAS